MMMNTMLPIRKITKYKKFAVVLLVIVFMYSSMVTYDYSDTRVNIEEQAITAINESELLRLKEERALPNNVIPNLHILLDINAMYMHSNREKKQCTFPTNTGSTEFSYTANITKSGFLMTEKTVFKNLTDTVRELTRQADKRLQQIMKVAKIGAAKNDVYKRMRSTDLEPVVKRELGIDFGSHLYFPGGHWIPLKCKAKWKVAVIIPYRNRTYNLQIFLKNLVPFLLNQGLEFGIFIAEQGFSETMNRGLIKNIGYQMAKLSGTEWDCYVFHDVDYVPINSTNYYGCDNYPMHYATKLEEFKYNNPYLEDFGGVVGLTGEQIDRINGYSNMYWGWGGEDSDLSRRVIFSKLSINRSAEGYYRDLPHQKKTGKDKCIQRFCLLNHAESRMKMDGLSEIRYENSANISLSTLYTKISVDVVKTDWNYNFRKCHIVLRNSEDHWIAVTCIMCYAGVMVLIFACAICGVIMRDVDHWSEDEEEGHSRRRKTKKTVKPVIS